jgi:hypothetical protein
MRRAGYSGAPFFTPNIKVLTMRVSKETARKEVARAAITRRGNKLIEIYPMPVGGFTEFSKSKVVRMGVPLGDSAHATTVRVHELLHANQDATPTKARCAGYHPAARNAIEDVIVQGVLWKPEDYPRVINRNALAVAFQEFRRCADMVKSGRAEDYNGSLCAAVRALAIVRRMAVAGSGNVARDNDRVPKRTHADAVAMLKRIFGNSVGNALEVITQYGMASGGRNNKYRKEAITCLQDLFRGVDGEGSGGKGEASGVSPDGGHAPVAHDEGGRDTSTVGDMLVVNLPLVHQCDTTTPKRRSARSGSRIIRSRMSRIVASQTLAGAFRRKVRQAGAGAYLIDASGSMGLNDHRLQQICQACPTGTVAYYSGEDYMQMRRDFPDTKQRGLVGALAIFSANGRRADKVQYQYGGNGCDLSALQWLLKQSGPRYFVSDGGFCGGRGNQARKCAHLLNQVTASGQVTWIKTVDELEAKLNLTR